MNLTKKISFTAILAALTFILLMVGSVFETVTLSVAAIASLCVIVAVAELGYGYAFALYLIISLLGFLLLPIKDPLLYFTGFFGYYPIVKHLAEKVRLPFNYVIKVISFSCSYALILVLGIKLFAPQIEINALIITLAFIVLLAVFFVYDYALNKLTRYYNLSLRKRLGIDKLLK